MANGTYTFSAWVRSSGGQRVAQLEAKRNLGGQPDVKAAIPASGDWMQMSIDIEATDGTLTVGFYSEASAKQWIYFDDVSLVRKQDGEPSEEGLPPLAAVADRVFGAGMVVDAKAKYGLAGNGVTDDTAGLRRAIVENKGRAVFLPAGTYLVSGSIEAKNSDGAWRSGFRLYGQSRDRTVIRLKDGSSGFGNAQSPRGVIATGSDDPGADGRGNRAFSNYVENLTVDTGNNVGAYGIDFLANNGGAVRDVVVRGVGVAGVAMVRNWPGPCLVQNVWVEGFDYGVLVREAQYSVTLEHVQVGGQRRAGLRNEDNILSVRDLVSFNRVPAVQNTGLGF